MPTTRGGDGTVQRRRIQRKTVSPLTGLASRRDNLAPALTAQHHADVGLGLGQPVAAARLARALPRHAFGGDPSRATAAAEAAHLHPPRHRVVLPGQVVECPPIPAVHPRRSTPADPTGRLGRRSPGDDQQPRFIQRQVIDVQAVRDRRHRRVRDRHRAAQGPPRESTPEPPPSTERAEEPKLHAETHHLRLIG